MVTAPRAARAAILLVAAGAAAWSIPPQDAQKLAQLEEKVREQGEALREQREALESLKLEVEALARVSEALGAAARRLDTAADESRKGGFEWAGANPRSRTDLLEGLKGFAKAIDAATRPKAPEGVQNGDGGSTPR